MRAFLAFFAMWFLMGPSTAGPTNLSARAQSNLRLAIPEIGVTLGGDLALPPTPGPHPAVVILGGLDDGSRALKEALTGQGVAVVTFDQRGSGRSTGTFSTWAPEVMADDALSWIRWLQKHPDIDRARIGLIGHSQGGVAATVPGLDHEFVVQSTNSPPHVPPGGGAFSSEALRLISEWITQQTKR